MEIQLRKMMSRNVYSPEESIPEVFDLVGEGKKSFWGHDI